MEQEKQQQEVTQPDATLFVKIGILILSIIALVGVGAKILPDAVSVSNIGRRKDLPIYSVETEDKKVALTFDTAMGNEDTQRILDILARNKVKATFFMTGEWIEMYPESVKSLVKAGHDLGNHSESHKHMSQLEQKECKEEIRKTHDRVKTLTGLDMNLFRAPYGDYNNTVVGCARDSGYYMIQWDVDSYDWKDYGVEDIIRRCTKDKNIKNGSIILMHNGAKYTPEALEGIILGLQEQGYAIVPVSELIYKTNFVVDHTGRQVAK